MTNPLPAGRGCTVADIVSPANANSTVHGGCHSTGLLYEYYIWNTHPEERIIPWLECIDGFHALDGKCPATSSGAYLKTINLWYGATVTPCSYTAQVEDGTHLAPTPNDIPAPGCPNDATICGPAGLSWYRCTAGNYVYIGQVAPGTVCFNGTVQPR